MYAACASLPAQWFNNLESLAKAEANAAGVWNQERCSARLLQGGEMRARVLQMCADT